MKLELLPAQIEMLNSNQRNVCMVGGLGSAKTAASIYKAVLTMIEINDPNLTILYAMPSFSLLTLRVRPGFESTLTQLGVTYKSNKSSQEITTPFGKIILKSFSEPERLVSFECALSFIDELDTISYDKAKLVYTKITERTRQKIPGRINQIITATTPDQGTRGYIYDIFGNITDHKNYKLIRAKTEDNIFLPDDYVDQIRANYTPTMAKCYLEGLFVNFALNGVYTEFSREKNHRDNADVDLSGDVFCGNDFNVGGCVVIYAVQINEILHVFKEEAHKDTRLLSQAVRDNFPDRWIQSYPDAAGNARSAVSKDTNHSIMNSHPFYLNVMTTGANPRILDRVNYVNTAFYKGLVTIDTLACPKLTAALEMQSYDEKTQQPEKSDKHDGGSMDDFTDAFGYMVAELYPINKPVIEINRYQTRK